MARAGLGDGWKCIFANDIDAKKCDSYALNWGSDVLRVGDIRKIAVDSLPKNIDLAWASFPCQDLSQAGAGAGLMGGRSGVFWPFWKLLQSLTQNERPQVVVLENVPGAITSHNGRDFAAICEALAEGDYKFGAILLDAAHFVPQSRVRLFFIAVSSTVSIPKSLLDRGPSKEIVTKSLQMAVEKLPPQISDQWIWWNLPTPALRTSKFSDMLCADDNSVPWQTPSETNRVLQMMAPLHIKKIEAAKLANQRVVGSIYKRRRCDGNGGRVQRAEVRFDDVAGCLRTPTGGASRQTIIVVDGEHIRTRILQPREAARLMGLVDTYVLPENYYEAYHLVGDGVVVPAVRYLAEHLLEPILDASSAPNSLVAGIDAPAAKPKRRRLYREPITVRFCWQRRRAQRSLARLEPATRTDIRSS